MAMASQGFSLIDVSNNDQRAKGLEYIESFVNATGSALRKARESRGDFGKTVEDVEPPKKKAKK
jgi:hypothetical protein